jgi:hypothetical protein
VAIQFSPPLAMGHSDLWVTLKQWHLEHSCGTQAHTHHITLVDCTATSPADGFRVTGTPSITGNGNYSPPFGANSTVQLELTGGNTVTFFEH